MRLSRWLLAVMTAMIFGLATNAPAAAEGSADFGQLLEMDLQQLMNLEVTLLTRSEGSQFSTPAAVYVLTQEDIRRSGYRRLPELLRLVPGLHVAKIEANQWAISSRSNLSRFSSTMLVMIDGRTIYTPFYAGVYWDMQDTLLEDIERIEVVRGPGGSLWGSNAVDGIINIITRNAADTHGTKAYVLGGSGEMEAEAGLRYGGSINDVNFRVFAKGYQSDTNEYLAPDQVPSRLNRSRYLPLVGDDANDDGDEFMAGLRLDWQAGVNRYMLQGSMQNGSYNNDRIISGTATANRLDSGDYNLVFNWERQLGADSSLNAAVFYDVLQRDDDIFEDDEKIFDLDVQYNLTRDSHQLAVGAGYRNFASRVKVATPGSCGFATPCFGVDPESRSDNTWSAFIQDRMRVSPTVELTIGTKYEHNAYSGSEFQPSLRAAWTPDEQITWWGAVTRAVRVPDRIGTDGLLDFGGGFTVPVGNKDLEAYYAYVYELGYRRQLSQTLVADLTVFLSDYRNTRQGSDFGTDDIYGFEGYLKYQPLERMRMELGYAYHAGRVELRGGKQDLNDLPKHSISSRISWDPTETVELDALINYVDDLESLNGNADVGDYTRVDLRIGWRPAPQWDVSLLLTNLLDDVHSEARDSQRVNTGVNRGAMLKVTYNTD